MCGLAHIFESQGFSTVLVGFVREHIEVIKPPRGLWLNFPMGRPMGKPNDPKYQKKVIRAAFNLLEAKSGPILEDFPDEIPVKHGRMGYAQVVKMVNLNGGTLIQSLRMDLYSFVIFTRFIQSKISIS